MWIFRRFRAIVEPIIALTAVVGMWCALWNIMIDYMHAYESGFEWLYAGIGWVGMLCTGSFLLQAGMPRIRYVPYVSPMVSRSGDYNNDYNNDDDIGGVTPKKHSFDVSTTHTEGHKNDHDHDHYANYDQYDPSSMHDTHRNRAVSTSTSTSTSNVTSSSSPAKHAHRISIDGIEEPPRPSHLNHTILVSSSTSTTTPSAVHVNSASPFIRRHATTIDRVLAFLVTSDAISDSVLLINVRAFAAILSCIVFWVGLYTFFDSNVAVDDWAQRNLIYLFVGLATMLFSATFLSEAAAVASSMRTVAGISGVLVAYAQASFGLIGSVLYWIGAYNILDTELWEFSVSRDAAYIVVGFALILFVTAVEYYLLDQRAAAAAEQRASKAVSDMWQDVEVDGNKRVYIGGASGMKTPKKEKNVKNLHLDTASIVASSVASSPVQQQNMMNRSGGALTTTATAATASPLSPSSRDGERSPQLATCTSPLLKHATPLPVSPPLASRTGTTTAMSPTRSPSLPSSYGLPHDNSSDADADLLMESPSSSTDPWASDRSRPGLLRRLRLLAWSVVRSFLFMSANIIYWVGWWNVISYHILNDPGPPLPDDEGGDGSSGNGGGDDVGGGSNLVRAGVSAARLAWTWGVTPLRDHVVLPASRLVTQMAAQGDLRHFRRAHDARRWHVYAAGGGEDASMLNLANLVNLTDDSDGDGGDGGGGTVALETSSGIPLYAVYIWVLLAGLLILILTNQLSTMAGVLSPVSISRMHVLTRRRRVVFAKSGDSAGASDEDGSTSLLSATSSPLATPIPTSVRTVTVDDRDEDRDDDETRARIAIPVLRPLDSAAAQFSTTMLP